MKARVAVVFLICIALPLSVFAGKTVEEKRFNEGNIAYEAGKYQEAFRLYGAAAAGGHPEANYMCGFIIYMGNAGFQDDHLVLRYWYKAAQLGSIDAMESLSQAYELGELGLPVEPTSADYWLKKADVAIAKKKRRSKHPASDK